MDYANILSLIKNSYWLIIPENLAVMLDIVDRRLDGERLSDEQIRARLDSTGGKRGMSSKVQAEGGVGVIPILGPIFPKANLMTEMSGATSIETFQNDFRALMANDMVKSIVMNVDSPGGVSDLIMEMGSEILAARKVKPIYAVANTTAGSAAYWLASQATQFFATPSGSVGSIGAYSVHEDHSVEQAQKGINTTFISAGRFKVEGSPFAPLSDEAKAFRQDTINKLYGQFVNAVAAGRKVSADTVMADYGEGRVLMAQDALKAGMIDGIGTLEQIIGEALSNAKTSKSVSVPSFAAAVSVIEPQKLKLNFPESAEWETSEPGTFGTPNMPDENDKSQEQGWRRDSPPAAFEPIETEAFVNREQLLALAKSTGLKVDDSWTDEVLFSKIGEHSTQMFSELQPLRDAAEAAATRHSFAEQFPEQAKRMAALEIKDRKNDAALFASSLKRLMTKGDDGELKATEFGFSTLIRDDVEKFHMAIADGTPSVEAFTELMTEIVNGGVVQFGEIGSSTLEEGEEPLTKPKLEGQDARQYFASLVKEEMKADKDLSQSDAIALVAEKNPEAFAAYQSPMVAR